MGNFLWNELEWLNEEPNKFMICPIYSIPNRNGNSLCEPLFCQSVYNSNSELRPKIWWRNCVPATNGFPVDFRRKDRQNEDPIEIISKRAPAYYFGAGNCHAYSFFSAGKLVCMYCMMTWNRRRWNVIRLRRMFSFVLSWQNIKRQKINNNANNVQHQMP